MNSPQPAPGPAAPGSAPPGRSWTGHLVNVLVALVVIAVAGAAFVFSYDGVHAIALTGGVSTQLARYYPGLFDAVLVIACVAAVMLRDGRWWARLWAWVVLIVVLGAIGTTDVLHAMNYTLRHRVTEGIVAAAPVVAVLFAFSLLLTLLRQSRPQAPAESAPPADLPALSAALSSPIALPAAPTPAPADPALPADSTVPAVLVDDTAPLVAPETLLVPVAVVAPAFAQPQDTPAEPVEAEESALSPGDVPTVEVPTAAVGRRAATRPSSIRYAGDEARDKPTAVDYWDAEDTEQFAGLVYPPRDDTDNDDNADESDATAPRLNRVRSVPAPPADDDE